MSKRKYEHIWIVEAIKYPDILRKNFGKFYALKKLNGLTIQVVYSKETHINVITIYTIK